MLEARNYRKSLRGGDSRPQVFLCNDDSEWVLKLCGNPLGFASLVADWMGCTLAHLMHVPMPAVDIANVDAEALATAPDGAQGWARPGPALATEFIVQSSNFIGTTVLFQCDNLSDLSRLVVLDTWVETLDRKKPEGTWNLLIDHAGISPRVVAIDFGFCLSEPVRPRGGVLVDEPDLKLACPDEQRPFIEWDDARRAVEDMMNVTDQQLTDIAGAIPNEWLTDEAIRTGIVEYLSQRRETVKALVEGVTP